MNNKRSIPGYKDENGCYVKEPSLTASPPINDSALSFVPDPEASLDDLLKRQLTALDRVTRQLTLKSVTGMSKDEIQSLATIIKLTMELKVKENELLDSLDDDALIKMVEA